MSMRRLRLSSRAKEILQHFKLTPAVAVQVLRGIRMDKHGLLAGRVARKLQRQSFVKQQQKQQQQQQQQQAFTLCPCGLSATVTFKILWHMELAWGRGRSCQLFQIQ